MFNVSVRVSVRVETGQRKTIPSGLKETMTRRSLIHYRLDPVFHDGASRSHSDRIYSGEIMFIEAFL